MSRQYRISIVGCVLLIALPFLVQAQSARIDSFRLKRDMRIMEGILDKLLYQDETDMQLTGDARGAYIPDYGMVFYVKKSQPYHPAILETLEKNISRVSAGGEFDDKADKSRRPLFSKNHLTEFQKEMEKVEHEALGTVKSGIVEFFSHYAPSASLLKEGDRIAVLVHLDQWRSMGRSNSFLTAWVDQAHAEALRRSHGHPPGLESDIHFDMNTGNASIAKDIDIMAEILDQAMNTGTTPRYSSTSGLYLKGLGALLFMDVQPAFRFGNLDTSFSIVIHNHGDAVSGGVSMTANAKRSGNDMSSRLRLEKLGDELFDLIASYGHTLQLEPAEQIIVEVNLGPNFSFFNPDSKIPSVMRMKITKRDLNAYNRGKISLKSLKEKLDLQYM